MSVEPDMLIVRVDDETEQAALSFVVGQDQARPNVRGLITAAAAAGRVYEQFLASVFFGLTYEGAVGKWRDNWNKLIGTRRGLLTEQQVVALADARRDYVNTADNTFPRAIQMMADLFPGKRLEAAQNFPNGAYIGILGGGYSREDYIEEIGRMFLDFQPPGHIYYAVEVPDTPVEFEQLWDEAELANFPSVLFVAR